LSFAAPLRADLADDVEKLRAAWSRTARVTVLSPRFPVPGEATLIALPVASDGHASDDCTTVAVLGAASTTFAVRLGGTVEGAPTESFLPSVAGAVHLVRCGADRASLGVIGIQMRSPRGVLETIVASSERPPVELRAVLPHRDPGAVPPLPGAGAPPAPAPLQTRVQAVEREFSMSGVVALSKRFAPTDATGSGQIPIDLAPGCHHIAVLAVSPETTEVPQDVDAELAWINGTIASFDRTDSPDAALMACTGERRLGVLAYGGSMPGVPVYVITGRTDLPNGLPSELGPDARARMAKGLAERHVTIPNREPVYESLGVMGLTELPIEVEPGQCYVALVSTIQGDSKFLSLGIDAPGIRARTHSDDPDSALASSFCAGSNDHAKLEVEAHGRQIVWVAALWPTARLRLGEEAP
jgi:hypothetical protein